MIASPSPHSPTTQTSCSIPSCWADSPAIVEAMSQAGFRLGDQPGDQPGLYSREGLSQVDLLGAGGGGRGPAAERPGLASTETGRP